MVLDGIIQQIILRSDLYYHYLTLTFICCSPLLNKQEIILFETGSTFFKFFSRSKLETRTSVLFVLLKQTGDLMDRSIVKDNFFECA